MLDGAKTMQENGVKKNGSDGELLATLLILLRHPPLLLIILDVQKSSKPQERHII